MACAFRGAQLASFPAVLTFVLHDLAGLVLPRLAPVFGDDRITQRAVILDDAHVQDVNETDVGAFVRINVDTLSGPGLVGFVAGFVRLKGVDFEEVEVDLVIAGHCENGAPVVLQCGQVRFLQRLPTRGTVRYPDRFAGPRVVPPRGAGALACPSCHENV